MGFAGKRETATAVQPQAAPIGAWAAQTALEFPFLSRNDILGLAGMRALLAVDTGPFSSTYITEGRHTSAEVSAASTHSLLRCTIVNSGATVLSCGALKPDCTFVPDWSMHYKVPERGEAVIEVPQFRTSEDYLRCGVLLVKLRDAVKEVLSNGIHLHLGDGPPSSDGLVVNVTADLKGYSSHGSPAFGSDYLGGMSGLPKEPLALPPAARNAVLAAMDATAFHGKPGSGDVLRVVSLAGPRQGDAGSVTLRKAEESDQLLIDIPSNLARLERQRSYRVALRLLARIAIELKESEPDVSASISAHAERIDADTLAAWKAAISGPMIVSKERALAQRENELLQKHWDKTTAALVVPLAAGRWYPVGVRVTTTAKDVSYLTRALQAADWVSNFKRTWTRGARQATRDQNRFISARRCGLLFDKDDHALPFLRYVWHGNVSDHLMVRAFPNQAWFWEANARSAPASEPSGQSSGMLFVSGWAHADGVLAYGENLLILLQAFADAVTALDDQAHIQTLYLAT